jgi:hypothetical protein
MPVAVSCDCGKQFKVADEYAGRKIKCPGCGGVLAVTTAPTARPPARAPVVATPTAPPGMVRFSCSCGKQMQARAEYAGKSVRCPACQTPVAVPAGEEEAAAIQAAPARRAAPPPPRMDADDDYDAPRPRRRRSESRKSGSIMPIILLASLLLLLIGGGVVAMLFFMGGGSGNEQAFVPGDATGIVSLRVADVWNHKSTKEAMQKVNPLMNPDMINQQMEANLGLKVSDIERVTGVLIMESLDKTPTGWGIVTLSRSVDENTLIGKIEGQMMGIKFQEKTYNGKKYRFLGMGPNSVAVHFPSSRMIILSNEEGMKRCLDQKGGKPSGVLERGVAELKGKHHMTGAFAITDEMIKKIPPDARPMVAPFLETKGILFSSDAADKSVTEITLVFDADDKAGAAKEALVGFKDLAIKALPALKGEGANIPNMAQGMAMAEAALRDLTIAQNGKDVTVKMQMDSAAAAVLPGLILPAIQKVREASAGSQSANNLKQLAVAMINYADAHQGQLPPFVKYSAAGKPLWSWRVELLPYLEQGAMYNQLKQDEPWNGPNNRNVLANMPAVFKHPNQNQFQKNQTHYQVFQGQGAVFNAGQRQTQIKYPAGIPDGTSNTIMIVEARNPVNWAAPNVLDVSVFFTPQGPHNFAPFMLGVVNNQPINAVMFDGSLRKIQPNANGQHLAWAIMPADGQPLPPGWEGR